MNPTPLYCVVTVLHSNGGAAGVSKSIVVSAPATPGAIAIISTPSAHAFRISSSVPSGTVSFSGCGGACRNSVGPGTRLLELRGHAQQEVLAPECRHELHS